MMRMTVRCRNCQLNQFDQDLCRRCKAILPEPEASEEVKSALASLNSLPTMDEMKLWMIKEAIRRTNNHQLAAKLLAIGKTTIYRLAKTGK